MATSHTDNRRRTSSSASRSRSGRSSSSTGRKPLQGRDTGYRVGGGRSRRPNGNRGMDQRIVIVGIIGIVVLIALVFGISSCVRSCSKPKQQEQQQTKEVNAQDERVAAGVSADETTRLSAVLDRNETFAKLAAKADKISDARLIDLAISEPEAIAFVYGSIKADGSTEAFSDSVTKGEYPKLYTFDKRWGYMEFGDGILGVTGSGPVALSAASMGLSGATTYDPATIAEAVVAAKLSSGSSGMDDAFVSNHGAEAGVVATSVDPSSDGIYSPVAEMSQPVLIRLKSGSGIGSESAHWALITALNPDNSITLLDPTSVAASSHSWSLGAVSAQAESAFALSAATADATADTGADTEGDGDATTETDDTATVATTSDTAATGALTSAGTSDADASAGTTAMGSSN